MEWFRKIFVPETQHLHPKILVMDGHGSHGTNASNLSLELLTLAKAEGIHIILLPPHKTNVLQPLDVGVFRPLKVNLSKLTDGLKLLSITGNFQSLDKTNFTAVFKEALDNTMCLVTIKNERKTGIYPYNPEAIDKTCLMPTLPLLSDTKSQSIEITPHQFSKESTLEVSSNEITPSNKSFKFPQRSDSTTTDNPSKCLQRIDSTPNDCVSVPSSEIPEEVLSKTD